VGSEFKAKSGWWNGARKHNSAVDELHCHILDRADAGITGMLIVRPTSTVELDR
jgi:hypothetical protein